jgi:hypothetical protein
MNIMADNKNPIYSKPFDLIDESDRKRLIQILKERMKRNEELGLESSPENTSIEYGMTEPGIAGYVDRNNPSNIVISNKLMQFGDIPLELRENLVKNITAHELDHVNRNAAIKNPKASTRYLDEEPVYGGNPHEVRESIVKPGVREGSDEIEHERRRILRSISHPSMGGMARPYHSSEYGSTSLMNKSDKDKNITTLGGETRTIKPGKPQEHVGTPYMERENVGYTNALIKYAEQAGISMDDIIDAMVINSALRTDKLAREAHDKTKENMNQGILSKLFGKSIDDVYKPWKEMKQKRKKK